ncbi:MAG: hypothetical protein MUF23_16790 [Pirellula sp.]|nr:hypothetical protein [Pirellula sp.]
MRQYVGVSNLEVYLETKHGLSPLLAASVSNRPYDHADALKYATYQTKTPDTFVSANAATMGGLATDRLPAYQRWNLISSLADQVSCH